jgi:hypothetical protein
LKSASRIHEVPVTPPESDPAGAHLGIVPSFAAGVVFKLNLLALYEGREDFRKL